MKGQTLNVRSAHLSCRLGHYWEATIINGYFLCLRCNALGACVVCVHNAKGKPKQGYCPAHKDLRTPETVQEVFVS